MAAPLKAVVTYGYRWETSINAAGKAETTYVQNDTTSPPWNESSPTGPRRPIGPVDRPWVERCWHPHPVGTGVASRHRPGRGDQPGRRRV